MKQFALTLFKYRSYTPIPFLLLMFAYYDANIWSLVIGFVIALAGEWLRLWGVSWAGSETRTTGAVGGTYLIIRGPFGFVRNPLYVGNILIYTGLGIMSNALFPYLQILAILFFIFQYYYIVFEEENYLRKTFTKQFEEYFDNVPRFFPRLTQYKDAGVVQPPFNFKAGLLSEKRTLQAFSIVISTMVLLRCLRTFS